MVMPNRLSCLQSLASELSVQAKRVRDLIGDAHWLSDGHHKEYLFLSLLQRHLPAGVIASRGFVVGHTNENVCSKEQDILIVDTMAEGPLFNQGHLLIAFPHQVRAVVSIKTTVSDKMVDDATTGMASVYEAAFPHGFTDPWFGIYFFEPCPCKPDTLAKYVKKATTASRIRQNVPADWHIDALACGDDLLCLKRTHSQGNGTSASLLRGYTPVGLSMALFLGHLLDHLSATNKNGESTLLSAMDNVESTRLTAFNEAFDAN